MANTKAGGAVAEAGSKQEAGVSPKKGPKDSGGSKEGAARRFEVEVKTLGRMVIEAKDEADARAQYQAAKNFVHTSQPWSVVELAEGQESAAPESKGFEDDEESYTV